MQCTHNTTVEDPDSQHKAQMGHMQGADHITVQYKTYIYKTIQRLKYNMIPSTLLHSLVNTITIIEFY